MNTAGTMYGDPHHPHYSEFLPIIDHKGAIIRVENRVKTHVERLVHPVVRGIMLTPDGQIIMQRKKLKSLPIEVLDTTISGHIGGSQSEMEALIGQNVFPLVIPTLEKESVEETGVQLSIDELLDLGQTGLYADLPEKREIAYVRLSKTRRDIGDLIGEDGIIFEAIDIGNIATADRTGRIAWDIIGEPWAHIWKQVQEELGR